MIIGLETHFFGLLRVAVLHRFYRTIAGMVKMLFVPVSNISDMLGSFHGFNQFEAVRIKMSCSRTQHISEVQIVVASQSQVEHSMNEPLRSKKRQNS